MVEVGVVTRLGVPLPNTESSAPVARRTVFTRTLDPPSSTRLFSRRMKASVPTTKMTCAPAPVSMRSPAAMRVAALAAWPLTVTAPLAS